MSVASGRGNLNQHLYRTRQDDQRRLTALALANQVALAGAARLRPSRGSSTLNITASHTHRFVWYRVAKVATRSIYSALKAGGLELELAHPFKIRVQPGAFDGYFRFAFVRHPVDRFESCWRDKVWKKNRFGFDEPTLAAMRSDIGNFVDFAEDLQLDQGDPHLRQQSHLIDLDAVDMIGRFERLADDFAVVAERIGRPDLVLPWNNKSPAKGSEHTIPDATRRRIESLYAIDFDNFHYH